MNLIKYENDKFYVFLSELEHLALCEQIVDILHNDDICSFADLGEDDLPEIYDVFKKKSPPNTYEISRYTFNNLLDFLLSVGAIGYISRHNTTLIDLDDIANKIWRSCIRE